MTNSGGFADAGQSTVNKGFLTSANGGATSVAGGNTVGPSVLTWNSGTTGTIGVNFNAAGSGAGSFTLYFYK